MAAILPGARMLAAMRCFVAAFLPAAVRDTLVALRPAVEGVRWVAPEKYHVTLRFLGELDPGAAAFWRQAAEALDVRFPVDCRAVAVDGFPNSRRARVIALTVDSGGALEALADALPAGGGDARRFRAHVTLARARRRPVRLPDPRPVDIPFRLGGAGLYRSVEGRYERLGPDDIGPEADLCS